MAESGDPVVELAVCPGLPATVQNDLFGVPANGGVQELPDVQVKVGVHRCLSQDVVKM